MNSQKGFTHILVLILLLLGIVAAVYLVQNGSLPFFSHASIPPIVFKNTNGSTLPLDSGGIPQSTSATLRIEFTSTLGSSCSSVSAPIVSKPSQRCTQSYRFAEDPNTLRSASSFAYVTEPAIIPSYTFKNSSLGPKFIFVEFKASDGTVDQRSAQVNIVSTTPTKTVVNVTDKWGATYRVFVGDILKLTYESGAYTWTNKFNPNILSTSADSLSQLVAKNPGESIVISQGRPSCKRGVPCSHFIRSMRFNVIVQPSSSPDSATIKDSFNRANNPSTLGIADSGQSWTVLRGTFGISNNQAYISSGCPAPGYGVVDGGSSDGSMQVTLAVNTQDARIPFRVKDISNGYFVERDGFGYHLEKFVNGQRIYLTYPAHNATFKNGDVIRIDLSGPSIKVAVNGSQLLSVSDSSILGTKYGIGTWCDTNVRFDDFSFIPAGVIPSPSTSPSPSPSPSPAAAKRVFVTSTAYNGNLGGLSGADQKCHDRANAANLGGTWKAWLSSSTQSAASRLTHATVPYKLINGTVIANNWTGLTANQGLQNPIQISEFNKLVFDPGGTYVWTNTFNSGERTLASVSSVCGDWTISTGGAQGNAGNSATASYPYWTFINTPNPCWSAYHLYCFEQ